MTRLGSEKFKCSGRQIRESDGMEKIVAAGKSCANRAMFETKNVQRLEKDILRSYERWRQ